MVEWCLSALSDAPNAGPIGELATQHLRDLSLKTHRDAFERHLKSLSKLNQGRNLEKPIDFGDAALIAALRGERRLLTADRPLFARCVSIGRTDVYCFDAGAILDSRRHPLRGA